MDEPKDAGAGRGAVSYSGLVLGVLMAVSGVGVVAFPADMRVHHTRMRRLPSVVEHVTPIRSRIYGASLLLGGVALIGFALYRPRR